MNKEPAIWTAPDPWTGYKLTLWPGPKQWGKTLENVYKSETTARRAARRILDAGRAWSVTIRKETVYRRTETAEYSISDPVAKIGGGNEQ